MRLFPASIGLKKLEPPSNIPKRQSLDALRISARAAVQGNYRLEGASYTVMMKK